MTMHASYGLPHFSIQNVTIHKESVNVKCFLELQDQFLNNYANKSKELLSNCEFYFLCTVPKNPLLEGNRYLKPEYLVNPSKRLHNIVAFYGLPKPSIIEWYSHLENIYPLRSISVEEVLGKHAKIGESSKESGVKVVNFEVDLPINKKVFEECEKNEIHVIGFSHINLKTMINSYLPISLNSNLKKYISLGGNMVAKKILEKDMSTGKMLPSILQTSLYNLDGSVYRGKAVYNDNGQITSKTPQGKESVLLKKETAIDTRISAPYLLKDSIQISGFDEKQESSKPIKNSPASMLGIKVPVNEIISEKDFYKPEIIKKLKEKQIKETIASSYKSPIQNAYSCIKAYNSDTYNYVNLEIDLIKLISQETEYGNLIDIANTNKTLNQTVFVSQHPEFGFGTKFLIQQLNLLDVVLLRNEKARDYEAATITGAVKKSMFEKSKDVSVNINSIPQISNLLLNRQNFQNSKSSIVIEADPDKPSLISVSISDKDFYKTAQAGEYSYKLKFKIGDRLSTYFHRMLELFDSLMAKFSKDLKVMFSGKSVSLYTETLFKNNIAPIDFDAINVLIDIYFVALLWSGKKMSRKEYDTTRMAIKNSVSLAFGGTVTDMERFREDLFSARNILVKLASKSSSKHFKGELHKKASPKSTKNKEVLFKEVVYNIPCVSAGIPDQSILMSYGNPGIKAAMGPSSNDIEPGFLQTQPEKFSYKDGASEKPLMSSIALFQESDSNAESKVLALENGIKSQMYGYKIAEHIAKKIQNFSISFAFGLSGVSVVVPGISAGKSKGLKPSPTTTQKDDNISGLGSVLEESLAIASTTQRSGDNKLQQQNISQQKQYDLAEIRDSILTKSMKVLNAVTEFEASDAINVPRPKKIDINESVVAKAFESRTGIILMGIKSNKAELEFVPVTRDRLKNLTGKEVVIKIKEPFKKEGKKNYTVINDTYKVTVEELKKYLF